MTTVQTRWMALTALGFFGSQACGDTTDDDAAHSAPGTSGAATGGVPTGGVATGGVPSGGTPSTSTGGYPPPPSGGTYTASGGKATGGYPPTGGAMSWPTGGVYTATGGYMPTGGRAESGGVYTAAGGTATGGTSPNGATCLCLLAESLHMPGGWPQVACTSANPNDCTLQKAYCGQSCAGDSGCAATCIEVFVSQPFDDAATYSWGSCTVIIRCPAPSS